MKHQKIFEFRIFFVLEKTIRFDYKIKSPEKLSGGGGGWVVVVAQ